MQIRIKKEAGQYMSFLLAVAPIFSNYKTGFLEINYGDILLVFLVLISLVRWYKKKKSIKNCYFLIYFSMYFVISIVQLLLQTRGGFGHFWPNWLRIATLVYLVDVAAQNDFDRNVLQQSMMWIGFWLAVILLMQAIADSLFGIQIFPYLRNVQLNYGDGTASNLISRQLQLHANGGWRYSSVFFEPAHFAQYELLALAAALFGTKNPLRKRNNLLCIVVITLSIFVAKSANGILLVIPVWLIFAFVNAKKKKRLKSMISLVLLLFGIGIVLVSTSKIIDEALDHVRTVTERRHGTTGNQRLLQGLAIYARFDAVHKLFGVGYGNLRSFLINNNITTVFLTTLGGEYMNGFSTVLVSSGIIGFLLFFWCWMRLFIENKALMNRVAFIVLSALFCTSNMFYAELTVTYLVFIKVAGSSQQACPLPALDRRIQAR